MAFVDRVKFDSARIDDSAVSPTVVLRFEFKVREGKRADLLHVQLHLMCKEIDAENRTISHWSAYTPPIYVPNPVEFSVELTPEKIRFIEQNRVGDVHFNAVLSGTTVSEHGVFKVEQEHHSDVRFNHFEETVTEIRIPASDWEGWMGEWGWGLEPIYVSKETYAKFDGLRTRLKTALNDDELIVELLDSYPLSEDT